MGAMAAHAGRRGEVFFLVESYAVRARPVGRHLARAQAVPRHQSRVFVTAGAGSGDVRRVDAAPRVTWREDRVRVVTVGTGRSVEVPLL